jgi:hypothetical protein
MADNLSQSLLTPNLSDIETVADVVFRLAMEGIDVQDFYANLCKQLSKNNTYFMDLLLSRCKKEFEEATDFKTVVDAPDPIKERLLAIMSFIGHLHMIDMLSYNRISLCIAHLLELGDYPEQEMYFKDRLHSLIQVKYKDEDILKPQFPQFVIELESVLMFWNPPLCAVDFFQRHRDRPRSGR